MHPGGRVDTALKSYLAVLDGVTAIQKQNMLLALGWIEDSFIMFEKQAEINLRLLGIMTEQARRQQETTDRDVLPIEDYDRLSVEEICPRLEQLDAREVEDLRAYEQRHKNRGLLLERLDRALV